MALRFPFSRHLFARLEVHHASVPAASFRPARRPYPTVPFPLDETVARAEVDEVLELDELGSFVRHKGRVRWLWIALCRRTRQVVASVFGDRSERTCRRLWERIPEDDRQALCYTDFWESYRSVVPEAQHEAVGKESGETNHVERWNLTLRQRPGRFVRRTLSNS